jgi:hypothetical protein
MTLKETLWFVLRLSLWCVFIVWPSYLLEVAIVAAFKQRVTPPFSTAIDVAVYGLPIVALVSAGYGLVLAGAAKLLPDFRAQTVAVLALAVLVQFWMRDAGEMILAVRPVPIGFGFLSLVAVSLFELGRTRVAPKPSSGVPKP